MNLAIWQAIYLATAAVVLPFSPFLFLLGQHTRRKVGLLPDAGGAKSGIVGEGRPTSKLLVIGESTVAGLGARTHAKGLAGKFAEELSAKIQKPVQWFVVGKNGVTAKRT